MGKALCFGTLMVVFAILVAPLDTLVLRASLHPETYRGTILDDIGRVYREEGLGGFFQGAVANFLYLLGLQATSS